MNRVLPLRMPLSGLRAMGDISPGLVKAGVDVAKTTVKSGLSIGTQAARAGIARRATDPGRVRRNLKKIARLKKRASRLKGRIKKLETRGRRFLGIPLGKGTRAIARLKRRVQKINGQIRALEAEAVGLQVKASTAATRAQGVVKGAEAREVEAQSRVAVEASRTQAEGAKQQTLLIGSIAAVAGAVLIAVLLKGGRSTREKETVRYHTARGAQ